MRAQCDLLCRWWWTKFPGGRELVDRLLSCVKSLLVEGALFRHHQQVQFSLTNDLICMLYCILYYLMHTLHYTCMYCTGTLHSQVTPFTPLSLSSVCGFLSPPFIYGFLSISSRYMS